jgi:hypothetical protein
MYVHTFEGESKEDGFGKLGGEGDKRQQHTHAFKFVCVPTGTNIS